LASSTCAGSLGSALPSSDCRVSGAVDAGSKIAACVETAGSRFRSSMRTGCSPHPTQHASAKRRILAPSPVPTENLDAGKAARGQSDPATTPACPGSGEGRYLAAVVRGHTRWYGVSGNRRALGTFRWKVGRLWWRALNRRSQNRHVTWRRVRRLLRRWLPSPRIGHPYPSQRLRVKT
jgi:hypothetical protein